MRTRRRLTWFIFAICIIAVLEGLGWVTWHALRLEKREREAQAATQFQQSIRLALWRMESEITPIIAAEAARPYFHYIPFYPAERAYTKMFQQVKPNEVLVPSPLLETSGRFIRLHYQIDPDGIVTSPQAPTGNMRDMAEAQYLDSEFIVLAGQMLDEVAAMVRPTDEQPVAQLGAAVPAPSNPAPATAAPGLQQLELGTASQSPQTWQIEDSAEYKAREKAAQTAQTSNLAEPRRRSQMDRGDTGQLAVRPAADAKPAANESTPPASVSPPPASGARQGGEGSSTKASKRDESDMMREAPAPRSLLKDFQEAGPQTELSRVEQGAFTPRWYTGLQSGQDELILERPVLIDGRETRQGIWVDWPQLREQLKASVADLLPSATLCPATDAATEITQRPPTLAAVPVRLLPGPMPAIAAASFTPTHTTLLVTWIAILGAIAAIGVVLRKAMELSERRGRFVSAVTHELRTPLTTFCLYTEMLSDGMVTDEIARQQYLGTLKSESNRLARIVQNVLDYAGIGGVGRRTPGNAAATSVHDVLNRVRPALEQSALRAGMLFEFDLSGLEPAEIASDPQTVERILLNLVENAGKYASEAEDRRIQVSASRAKLGKMDAVLISVRDHGPGIPRSERRNIFHAFHRAARDANGSKSGLGLGLALARELAGELGGNLDLNARCTEGADFQLTIPARYLT